MPLLSVPDPHPSCTTSISPRLPSERSASNTAPHRSHGTFRPRLLTLVQSNPPTTIRDTTRTAFAPLITSPFESAQILSALKTLTTLAGIGPATASLLLSTLRPGELPFFSDELYRWAMFEEGEGKGSGKGGRWERGIAYSVKEYGGLLGKVEAVRARLGGVSARELEMVAWVLGREGGKAAEEETEEDAVKVDGGAEGGEVQSKSATETAKGTSRKKANDAEAEPEKTANTDGDDQGGRRRSKRLKTIS